MDRPERRLPERRRPERDRSDRVRPLGLQLRPASGDPSQTVAVVHPGALPAGVHRHLAAALREDVGVVVLDLQSVPAYWQAALSAEEPRTSVEALAEAMLRQLHEHGVTGQPDVLVGWSFGGVVAHAMTSRVGMVPAPRHLVLLDSIAPVDEFRASVEELEESLLLQWFAMYLGARGEPGAVPLPDATVALEDLLAPGVAAGVLPPGTTLDGLRKLQEAFLGGLRRNCRLVDRHRAVRTDVPTTVVRPAQSLLATPGALGWEELTPPGLRLARCPGDHYSMLSHPRAVAVLVDVLEQRLAELSLVP